MLDRTSFQSLKEGFILTQIPTIWIVNIDWSWEIYPGNTAGCMHSIQHLSLYDRSVICT